MPRVVPGHSPGPLGFCCRPKLVDNLDAVGCCPVDGSLGELSSATSASEEARDHHGQALTIAQEIGAHPEEARALAGIGMSLLPRSPAEAAAHLRKALAIYRRIGSPDAQPVQDTLDEHGL